MGVQFECTHCGVWVHGHCAYDESILSEDDLPFPPLCHHCQDDAAIQASQGNKKKKKRLTVFVYRNGNEGSADEGTVLSREDGQARVRFKRAAKGVDRSQQRALDEWIPEGLLLSRGEAIRRAMMLKLFRIKSSVAKPKMAPMRQAEEAPVAQGGRSDCEGAKY